MQTKHITLRLAALALSLACTALSAQAQGAAATDEVVLRGGALNEANLVNALTPPQPQMERTRSIKIQRDGTYGAPPPARKASASLLITFETNSAELTPPAKQQLAIVAAALKNDRLANYSFSVEGHADPRGTAEGNMTLSQQRAESVRQFLTDTHGVPEARLHAEGKGDTNPLNRQYLAAPENRRVTIVTNMPTP
jgi:OOP family OmpA-OmpF porin